MSSEFSSALRREIAALEAELANSPTYRRLKALRQALVEYEGRDSPSAPVARHGVTQYAKRRHTPAREAVFDFVRKLLADRDYPTPTRDIFSAMQDANVEIGGKQPINNLSAMLSNSDEFVSYGRSGWLLKKNDSLRDLDIDLELPGAGEEGKLPRLPGATYKDEGEKDPFS